MRVASYLTRVWVVGVVAGVASGGPQGVGVRVNNNALFTLGAGLLITGLAYHAGRQSAIREQYPYRYNTVQGYYVRPYYFRRRRQAESENELDPRVERLFQMALEQDTSGCVLQLTCAIGSMPPSKLTGHAMILHAIVSAPPQKIKGGSLTGKEEKLQPYRVALEHGSAGGDCDKLFPRCLTPPDQLLHRFQAMAAITPI